MRAASLLYHDVVGDDDFGSSGFPGAGAAVYKMRAADFEGHLAAIAAAVDSRPVRVDALEADDRPAVPWMLTFDDGGRTALHPTADLLDARSWRGHFFITASCIGRAGFLDADGMRALVARGHVVGSHSWSHPARFSALSFTQMRDEWVRSVEAIGDALGEAVTVASVPGGFYSRGVARSAAEAGIRHLFTSEPVLRCRDVGGCRVYGRLSLRRGSPAKLAAAFATGRPGPRAAQWAAWNVRKTLKRLGGPAYEAFRERLLRSADSGGETRRVGK